MMRRFALTAAALISFAAPARAAGFTVAELFTSQSCSSCPPADALLGELAKDPAIIALGCHVTYWDHLNWRDTLSLPLCTARQYAYNRQLDQGVFTPQLVIDGTTSFVGGERRKILASLQLAKRQRPYTLAVTRENGALKIVLPAVDNVTAANVLLVRYGDPVTLPIGGGENGGRTLTYTNPVLALDKVGVWHGPQTLSVPIPAGPGHIAVLAQDETGRIVGAGRLDKP